MQSTYFVYKLIKTSINRMFRIVLLLIAGAGVGFLARRCAWTHHTERAAQILICILLFVFGISLGNNRELLLHLDQYGYHAFTIALLATLGSLVAAAVAQRLFFRKGGRS